ncbi:hypothetical protein GOP47_0011379 [Adiantum capillus-veneris]|uniref:PRONE domain-containing protein n=1 Tax=Adiantum capillus-veneris TaxID=13818 RepID=A0A9D4UT63_ADICA|nr:hypothetical protein GOP47_0011379 [Adiantum capillus-veneris]
MLAYHHVQQSSETTSLLFSQPHYTRLLETLVCAQPVRRSLLLVGGVAFYTAILVARKDPGPSPLLGMLLKSKKRSQFGVKGLMMLKNIRARSFTKPVFDVLPNESPDQQSADGTSSTASFDRFCADILGEGSLLGSPHDTFWDGDDSTTSNSVESSPLGWPRSSKSRFGKLHSLPKYIDGREATGWGGESRAVAGWAERTDVSVWAERRDGSRLGEKQEKTEDSISEADMIKERFAKLLLGEDLSGGSKGVSSALAISNAITNLSASIFGELWRLEPMAAERKARWHREMGWLLSVSDHIVEFVPSVQTLPDGTATEVMVTKTRSDLHMNLPALRKLDTMLLEGLDSFEDTEFWYIDRAVAMAEKDGALPFRHEEKWWLPVPRVPAGGLSVEGRKQLQHQRDSVNQILKAALAINAQVLSEMEVPSVYWEALPKNGRSSLGEALYAMICSERFSPDALIASLNSTHEHNILELVNRVEAALYIWRRKLYIRHTQAHVKDGRTGSKGSWGLTKDGGATDLEKRELLSDRAESLLMLLRQKFPGLPQTILDMNKIQYNKDVGQSILESYSRILESLAFNVLSKINDVLHVDDVVRCNHQSGLTRRPPTNRNMGPKAPPQLPPLSPPGPYSGLSKSASVHVTQPHHHFDSESLSEFIGRSVKTPISEKELEHYAKSPPRPGANKPWFYSGSINALRSPPSRD